METLIDIWRGWLQFGLSDTTRWFYFSIDAALIAVAVFLVMRSVNTKRNLGYLALIGLALAVLVLSAYLSLPGLHVMAQFMLVLLAVGLPIFFGEKWRGLFGEGARSQLGEADQPYLGVVTTAVVSLVGTLLIVGLASGIGAKTAELPVGVPLAAVNLPEGLSASFGGQVTTKIIVSAKGDKWRSLSTESFSASVDVAKQTAGTYDLPVTVVAKVSEVKIIRLKPSRVTVTVEPVIRKTVAVSTKFVGKAGGDLVPDEAIINPLKVEASGPKSVISELNQGIIQIRLNGDTQPIRQKYSVVALNSNGEVIGSVSFNPPEVEASVDLVIAGKTKTIGIRPVVSGAPQSGFWVRNIGLEPPVVSVTGTAEALSALQDIPTRPIPVAGLNATKTLTVTLDLPNGIILSSEMAKISATVTVDVIATTKTFTPELQYDGLNSALKITALNPTSVTLLASGATDLLAATNDGELKLKLNLSPYQSAGVYSLTVRASDFTLKDGVSLVSFLPSAISVTLENR